MHVEFCLCFKESIAVVVNIMMLDKDRNCNDGKMMSVGMEGLYLKRWPSGPRGAHLSIEEA